MACVFVAYVRDITPFQISLEPERQIKDCAFPFTHTNHVCKFCTVVGIESSVDPSPYSQDPLWLEIAQHLLSFVVPF